MATRDQWYKPNLLYNIHYRPPKKVEPPKMIVQTSLFNPSVCTCGEHGCEPKYRMERRVLWSNKEIDTVKQEDKTGEDQKIVDSKDLEDKERIKIGQDSGDVQFSCERNQCNDDGNVRADSGVGFGVRKINTDGVGSRSSDGGSVRGDNGVGFGDGVGSRDSDEGKVRGDNDVGFGDGVRRSGNEDARLRNYNEYGLGNEKISVAETAKQGKVNGSDKGDDRGNVADQKIREDDVGSQEVIDIRVGRDGSCVNDDVESQCRDKRVGRDGGCVNGKFHTDDVGGQCKDIGDGSDGGCVNGKFHTDDVGGQCTDIGDGSDGGCVNGKFYTDDIGGQCKDIGDGSDGGCVNGKFHTDDVGGQCTDIGDGSDGGCVNGKFHTDDVGGQCTDIGDGSDGEAFSVGGNGNKHTGGVGSGEGSVRCDGYDGEVDGKICKDGVASQWNSDVAIVVKVDGNVDVADVCQNEETQESDVEISSSFGIMSVYCNSELHSWRMVKDEDNIE